MWYIRYRLRARESVTTVAEGVLSWYFVSPLHRCGAGVTDEFNASGDVGELACCECRVPETCL